MATKTAKKSDPNFAEGLRFFEKPEKAPEWVIGNVSIHKEKFQEWIEEQEENSKGYINLNIKRSKQGKVYVVISDWNAD